METAKYPLRTRNLSTSEPWSDAPAAKPQHKNLNLKAKTKHKQNQTPKTPNPKAKNPNPKPKKTQPQAQKLQIQTLSVSPGALTTQDISQRPVIAFGWLGMKEWKRKLEAILGLLYGSIPSFLHSWLTKGRATLKP